MKIISSIIITLGVQLALFYSTQVVRAAGQMGPGATASEGVCTKKHDRFRNRETVTSAPQTVYKAGSDELKLGASAVIEGENKAAPKEVDLLFDSTTSRLRYGNSAEVRFIIDGKRVEGGTAYKYGGEAMRQVKEKLRLTMSAARFLEISGGREVEMRIGDTEVTLSREDVKRLRDFATCAGISVVR